MFHSCRLHPRPEGRGFRLESSVNAWRVSASGCIAACFDRECPSNFGMHALCHSNGSYSIRSCRRVHAQANAEWLRKRGCHRVEREGTVLRPEFDKRCPWNCRFNANFCRLRCWLLRERLSLNRQVAPFGSRFDCHIVARCCRRESVRR